MAAADKAPVNLPCAACTQPCCSLVGNSQWNALGGDVMPNGDCEHLLPGGKCGIYETRPAGCRTFRCDTDTEFLRRHPEVRDRL